MPNFSNDFRLSAGPSGVVATRHSALLERTPACLLLFLNKECLYFIIHINVQYVFLFVPNIDKY